MCGREGLLCRSAKKCNMVDNAAVSNSLWVQLSPHPQKWLQSLDDPLSFVFCKLSETDNSSPQHM